MRCFNFCVFYNIFCFLYVSTEVCEPDDEFDGDTPTEEWDNFMDKLTQLTFDQSYKMPCMSDPNEEVEINYESDFLWNLRFSLYEEKESTDANLETCYNDNQTNDTCDTGSFKDCMKNARTSMLTMMTSSWWNDTVTQELTKMAEGC